VVQSMFYPRIPVPEASLCISGKIEGSDSVRRICPEPRHSDNVLFIIVALLWLLTFDYSACGRRHTGCASNPTGIRILLNHCA
jgi:hypothetical protein